MQEDIIDLSAIERLKVTLGSEAGLLLPELIDEFNGEAPLLLESARQAIADGSASDLRRIAHTLKSNSATFGAHALAERCRELEDLAKLGRIDEGARLVASLQGELAKACQALQDLQELL